MKVDKKDIQKWIDALRSGKYKQAHGTLQNADGFCCLGVACKVFVPNYPKEADGSLLGIFPVAHRGAPEWLEEINHDFERRVGSTDLLYIATLGILNDSGEYSFDEIADLLQAVYIEEVLK